jgi:hypothetical protein
MAPAMKFSRHSKNRCRKADIAWADVETALEDGETIGTDRAGNPIYEVRLGVKVLQVVVALDEPDFVITLIEKRKR